MLKYFYLFLSLSQLLLFVHSDPTSDFEAQYSELRPAKNKFDDIWRMMLSMGPDQPPYPKIFTFLRDLNLLPFIPGQNLARIVSFGMFRPWSVDHKLLHTHPSYATVKFTFNEEAHEHYTGLFESDVVDYGLMSLSPGFKVPNITNFFAVSIRSFRDNVPAGALIAAFNLISVPNWNVFDYMICTHYNWLMALPLALLGPTRAGQGWTKYFNQFGLANFAEYKQNGERVANPKFPWAMCFIPNQELRERFAGRPASNNAVELMQGVMPNDTLYEVWAIKEPYPLVDANLLSEYSHRIGSLVATSSFVTSNYGARRLLGTHPPFEQDLRYRPDWIPFASPFYLTRAGAVGAYRELFPIPNPDVEQAQLNLMLLMTGVVDALAESKNFVRFLSRFGLAPRELYQNTVGYLMEVVLPSRMKSVKHSSINPPLGLSVQWAMNTIRSVTTFVTRFGFHPPLGPLQLSQLGSSHGVINGRFIHNGTQQRHLDEVLDDSRAEKKWQTVEDTLFKNVHSLPFHLHAFNALQF